MNATRTPGPITRQQNGAVLVISLLLLLVLTIMAVSSTRSTVLEERMTGNYQDASIALQAAEAALRAGEQFLRQPALPVFDGSSGLYEAAVDTDGKAVWQTVDWTDDSAVRLYDGFEDAPGSLSEATARFLIEELDRVVTPGESLSADSAVDQGGYYRITARGVGVSGNAVVQLQSTYRR